MKDDDYYNPSCSASIASPDSAAQFIHSSDTLKLYFHLTSLCGADDTSPQSSNPQYQLCHTLEKYLCGSLSSFMVGQCNSKILQSPETEQAWTVFLSYGLQSASLTSRRLTHSIVMVTLGSFKTSFPFW